MKLQAPLNIFVCFKMQAAKSSNLVLHIYKVISNQIKKGKKEKKYTNTSRIFNKHEQVFCVLVCVVSYFVQGNLSKSQSAQYVLLCYGKQKKIFPCQIQSK